MYKKLIGCICFTALLTGCANKPVEQESAFNKCVLQNAIINEQQIVYLPKKKIWATESKSSGKVLFTKTQSIDDDKYSVYKTGKKSSELPTTYEFVCNGKLYGYNGWDWKFYEINYKQNNKKLEAVELTQNQMDDLFEGIEVIPLSETVDDTLVIKIRSLKSKKVLLWNDTDWDFYGYSYEGKYAAKTPFASYITPKYQQTLTYSHPDSQSGDYPKLTIKLR